MKLKSLAFSTIAAVALASTVSSATASTLNATNSFQGTSFSDFVIGTIHIDSLSNLTGSLFAADSVTFNPFPGLSFALKLDSVSFSSASVGTLKNFAPLANGLAVKNVAAGDFSFTNVAAGDYVVKATGSLLSNGQVNNFAFLGANYNVTAVPEPESYAMLLAGLGLMGAIARRRNKSNVG